MIETSNDELFNQGLSILFNSCSEVTKQSIENIKGPAESYSSFSPVHSRDSGIVDFFVTSE
jgi:hypothetical protein